MEKILSLEFLKDYIPNKNDQILKSRPECLYIPRPPARRKYQTAIRPPDKNFFDLMIQRGVYLWVVVKKNIDTPTYEKIFQSYKSVKSLKGYQRLPICKTYDECRYWVKLCPCQIVIFEDAFDDVFEFLSRNQNACGFHVISSDKKGIQIAKLARQNRKIRNIYDDESYILSIVKQNMERLAITEEQKHIQKTMIAGQQFKRLLVRNIVFPNFIKLSKHDKSQHNQYRLHLIGLRKLTIDDKLASKDKFVEFSRQKFPNDEELIQQYSTNSFENPKEILRFYTLDSFFYRVLNNTLRIAKNTEEFFSIGEPFNKVFDAIKTEYGKAQKIQGMTVYRGADLTPSQCQYLEQNIGKYIEINGFISTSKSLQTAKNFARERKNNTIFKITFKKIPQKFSQYDYGYVDLQLNKCSAFDEDEVLINALNVFRIAGKQDFENFVLYVLEYGSIFDILEKDPNTLNENDKFAYYSFRELKQMNEEVKDIGEVYLRTFEPEKAIEIYEFKLQKMKESIEPVKKDDIDEVLIKAADAYLANGQPDKALKYYESTFISKKKRRIQKKHSLMSSQASSTANQTELIEISTKVTSIQNNNDKFEQAEEIYHKTTQQIEKEMKQQWNIDVMWSKIDLQWEIVEGKKTQMLYEEQYQLLKQIEATLTQALKKIKGKGLSFQQKKVRMKLTEVYESMAQTTQQSQTAKSRISQISSSFSSIYDELNPLVEKNSYEEGLINIRRSEIIRRSSEFDEQKELRNYKRSISLIQKNTQQTDQVLPKVYSNLADLQSKLQKNLQISEAIGTYKKQLKIETIIYSESDPKPLNTKMKIAICERDDKNTQVALQEFSNAYHTELFKKKQAKYTIHAKILFNMSQAYTDKGEDGLAMKNLKEAYQILQKQLSKKDFDKSVLRYKIKLRIGRIYMSSSIRSPENLKYAETNLLQYHKFITKFYKHKHSDVALSHNCLGALYSTLKKFIDSRENFQTSIEIYSETLGTKSMEVAKITANLAICYAQLKNITKATQALLKSRQIFEKIYSDLKKNNPFQYESLYIQSEIETLAGEYQKAIDSCEKSKEAQRIFLQSKKKNNSSPYIYSEFFNNDSFNTKNQNTRPQYNSLMNPNLFSVINVITEHGFKCDFHICECYIYLKNLKEAKKRLQKLKDQLIDRIQRQRVNPLFKDGLYGKKQFYLKKSQHYLQKVTRAIEKKQRQQRQHTLDSPLKPINSEPIDNHIDLL